MKKETLDSIEVVAESAAIGTGAAAIGFAINDAIHMFFVVLGGIITAFIAGFINSWWKDKERKKELDHILKIKQINSELKKNDE
jgi:hypothetical protein